MIGKKTWVIAEGYIPSGSTGPKDTMESHETACILNPGNQDANIEFIIYYADKNPVGPYKIKVKAERTNHVRFNDLRDPEPIPRDTDYACVITSDMPIIVQHTRLDSRQSENALLSTMAYYAA